MSWPSASARTKTWGTEILTTADQHAQLDLLHSYFNDSLNGTTGHGHTGGTSDGPKISAATGLTIASQAQGDVLYASSSTAFARLGAGTAGMFLKTLGAAANPAWAYAPIFKLGTFTYDLNTASATQNSPAIGFTPRLVFFFGSNASASSAFASWGIDDGTNAASVNVIGGTNHTSNSSYSLRFVTDNLNKVDGKITSLADPFVITWTKTGTISTTMTIVYLAIQ